jgi:hypothetical protein
MPYIILIPAHGLGKFISHLGVRHYITKTHLGGQDTLHFLSCLRPSGLLTKIELPQPEFAQAKEETKQRDK